MAAGFERRYANNPGAEVLGLIEGTVIIDGAPPGNIQGVQSGCFLGIGECSDASYAVSVDANGNISANPRSVRVFSAADLEGKIGGLDETIGNFGTALGNLFASLANKRYPFLVVCPIDNITPTSGTNKGIRVWRDLPTNRTSTSPIPVVPMQPGVVAASREFKSGANRVRLARRVVFSDAAAFHSAIDGSVATAAAAATQTFTSAGSDFVAKGVQVGDILVLGVLGTNNAANTKTLRVQAVTSATQLEVERMDGANFAFVTEASLAFRLHPAKCADSSGVDDRHVAAATVGGYTCAARPLDATVAGGTILAPTIIPDAATATAWDTLSGLGARVSPGTALTYSANVHAPNAANNSDLDARYLAALAATMNDDDPNNIVNIVGSSRKSPAILTALRAHCETSSGLGLTRRCVQSPLLSTIDVNVVIGTDASAPAVGASRSERRDYSWPGVQHFVPGAVGRSIARADGGYTMDGYIDDTADFWLASVEANIPPEENPGQIGDPYSTILSLISGFQRNLTTRLGMAEYIALKQAGVCALRRDREDGFYFQSGVTSDLTSGRTTIARRRMADFIQDSIARRTNKLVKGLAKERRKDSIVTEITTFLDGLKSESNPDAQRIGDFLVDDQNGNTPELTAAGIFVIITKVQTLPSLDVIVLQTEIGPSVVITRTL